MDFSAYKQKMRTMKQYRDLPDIEYDIVIKTAYEKYVKNNLQANADDVPDETEKVSEPFENEVGVWINEAEANDALDIYKKYVDSKNYTNISDLSLLKTLVFYEIQLKRIQKAINAQYQKNVEESKQAGVPTSELKSVNDINVQVIELKKALGLAEENKGVDPVEPFNQFKRKCFKWAKEQYQASRYRKCPTCGETLLLLMRPEVWEAYKHPNFKDNYLFNVHLWKCYKEGKITVEDVALILVGSLSGVRYIKWLEEKIIPLLEKADKKESGDL